MGLIKVTDLEKFAREEIYLPYACMIMKSDNEIDKYMKKKLKNPYTLENAVQFLITYPRWSSLVLKRIYGIGFYFPEYIKHNLVDFIEKSLIK